MLKIMLKKMIVNLLKDEFINIATATADVVLQEADKRYSKKRGSYKKTEKAVKNAKKK